MKYNKPAVRFENQIAKLKARQLLFFNETQAKETLSRISFYRLRAYTYPFQDNANPNHPFVVPIHFETILKLYNFDSRLRLLVFGALEKIEVAFRTQMIYQFSIKHGPHWHIDKARYYNKDLAEKHLERLRREVSRSQEIFIKHYQEKYTSPKEPPCWMGLEVASLGTLSQLYSNTINSDEKKAVSKSFGINNLQIFQNWLHCCSNLRNICAHHGRLWNRRLTQPSLPENTPFTFLNQATIKRIYKNKLYATLCCVKYLLDRIDPDNDFHIQLKKGMDSCPLQQEKEMGFPANWQEVQLWH